MCLLGFGSVIQQGLDPRSTDYFRGACPLTINLGLLLGFILVPELSWSVECGVWGNPKLGKKGGDSDGVMERGLSERCRQKYSPHSATLGIERAQTRCSHGELPSVGSVAQSVSAPWVQLVQVICWSMMVVLPNIQSRDPSETLRPRSDASNYRGQRHDGHCLLSEAFQMLRDFLRCLRGSQLGDI